MRPLNVIGRLLLFTGVLPLYKIFLAAKKIGHKFYAPQKSRHKLIHPFSRRYLLHIILIIITILTVKSNLNADETKKENPEQINIIAALVTTEDLGDITQEGPITPAQKPIHYLRSNSVSVQSQINSAQNYEEYILPTMVSNNAIVRPMISPVVEQQAQQSTTIVYYTVAEGDTISTIAAKFGVSVNTILWENNLTAFSLIRPGDKLTILPTSGITYKVAKTDSLAKIAKKFGVTVDDIIDANKLASINDIRVGETLLIPGGKKIYIAPPQPVYVYKPPKTTTTKTTASGQMVWPSSCYHISQYYTWRHHAIDIACAYGSPIHAADSGRVVRAQGGWNGGYGNITIIDHGNGRQTLYGHQSVIYVSVGEYVTKGQVIGAEGSTGRSTGPHLHFEVRSSGGLKNPLSYVR